MSQKVREASFSYRIYKFRVYVAGEADGPAGAQVYPGFGVEKDALTVGA